MDEDARDRFDASLPALGLEPPGELAGGGDLGSLLAAADQRDAGLDDHHVAALERTRR